MQLNIHSLYLALFGVLKPQLSVTEVPGMWN